MSTCSGCPASECGSADRALRLLSFISGPSTCLTPSSTSGSDDGAPEDVTLVDEVGEAMGILLGLELAAGLLPFFLEQLEDPAAQLRAAAAPMTPSRTT